MIGFAGKIIGLSTKVEALLDGRATNRSGCLEDLLASRRLEEGKPACARPENCGARIGSRPRPVQGRRHRQAHLYLVAGQVELRADDRIMGVIRAGTAEARTALAPGLPRRFTARAAMDLEYIMIDSDLLDVLLTWDQTGQYEVAELRGDGLDVTGDWMTTLLQTKAFHRIPPANIQAIFMRMQRLNYRAGDIIIKQGTEGDYFYVVVAGKCVVTRETPLNKEGIKLAELGPGDSFGEEALIPRPNAMRPSPCRRT